MANISQHYLIEISVILNLKTKRYPRARLSAFEVYNFRSRGRFRIESKRAGQHLSPLSDNIFSFNIFSSIYDN